MRRRIRRAPRHTFWNDICSLLHALAAAIGAAEALFWSPLFWCSTTIVRGPATAARATQHQKIRSSRTGRRERATYWRRQRDGRWPNLCPWPYPASPLSPIHSSYRHRLRIGRRRQRTLSQGMRGEEGYPAGAGPWAPIAPSEQRRAGPRPAPEQIWAAQTTRRPATHDRLALSTAQNTRKGAEREGRPVSGPEQRLWACPRCHHHPTICLRKNDDS
jgi:hypothetical protein